MRRGIAIPESSPRRDARDAEWAAESRYWRAQYLFQPYYELGRPWDFYAPAFRLGYETAVSEPGARFDELEPEMQRTLHHMKRHPDLDWASAEPAARAAWLRVERGRRRPG